MNAELHNGPTVPVVDRSGIHAYWLGPDVPPFPDSGVWMRQERGTLTPLGWRHWIDGKWVPVGMAIKQPDEMP